MNLLDLISKGMEERKRTEALTELQRLAAALSGETPASTATETAAAPATSRAPVLVEPDGTVKDAGGWFSAAPKASWVNDSENLFRSDLAELGTPRLGGSARASTTPAAAFVASVGQTAAPSVPQAQPTVSARSTGTGGRPAFGVNERIKAMALAKQAGLDPLVLDQAMTLAGDRIDPYGKGNLAFGKTATGPWRATPYGDINAATGQRFGTPYAEANTDYRRAQAESARAPYRGGSYGVTNRFTGEQVPSDLGVAQTGKALAQIGQAETAAARNVASAGKARRVALADGTLVEAVEQPDGRLTVRPITDTSGAPVRSQQPSQARQYARAASPDQVFVQRFNARAAETGNAKRAEEKALADMAILFPTWQPGQAAEPAGVSGAAQAPVQAQAPAMPSALQDEITALDAELAEAIRVRPDLAERFRAQALRAKQELLGGAGAQR